MCPRARQFAITGWLALVLAGSIACGGGGASSLPPTPPPVPACDPSTAPEVLSVTVQSTASEAVQNYPVAIPFDSTSFDFTLGGASGSEIAVWDSQSQQALPFWIESYDAVAGKGLLWVKVPALASQGSTTIWLTGGTIAHCAAQTGNGYAVFPFFSDVTDVKSWNAINQLSVSDQIIASPLQISDRHVIQSDGTYNASPSVETAPNGDWVLGYKKGTTHTNDPLVILRRSQDEGVSWSPEVVYFGLPGMDPSLLSTPGGDLLLASEKTDPNGLLGAAYARSTDFGMTWSPFIFFDNPVNHTSSFATRFVLDGPTIYGPSYTSVTTANGGSTAGWWLSSDDGLTWSKRSEIRQAAEPGISETGVAKVGATSLLAVSRTDSVSDTLVHSSSDLGLTWGAAQSYFTQVGVLQLPQLIQAGPALILMGRETVGIQGVPSSVIYYPQQLVAFVSYDNGQTFSNGIVLDDYTGVYVDGGYSWPMIMSDGRIFVVYYADSNNLSLPDMKSLILSVGTPQSTASNAIHVASQFAPGVAAHDLNISATRYSLDFRFRSHEVPDAGQFSVGLAAVATGQNTAIVDWELPSTHASNPRTGSGFIANSQFVRVMNTFSYDQTYRVRTLIDETQNQQQGLVLDQLGNVVSSSAMQPLAQGTSAHANTVTIGNDSSLRTTDTLLDFVLVRPVASAEPQVSLSRLR